MISCSNKLLAILILCLCTVEPQIKDTIENTFLQRALSKVPKMDFLIVLIHFHL